MDIFIVTLEPQEIFRLLSEAENKIKRFEQKTQQLLAAIEPLKVKREAVLAALEYAGREQKRRKLTDLFVRDGEYGLPINFSAELLSQIEQRKLELDRRINSYEDKHEKRLTEIEFIRYDIELLKKIQHLELTASLHESAAMIDG